MSRTTEWHSAADKKEAFLLYFGAEPGDIDPPDNDLLGRYFDWYIHDFRPTSTGRTLVEDYLRRRSGRLTAAELELLESLREARFGIWEVQNVEEGKGVELKDLFSEERFFVHDVSCSRSMVRWDCVLSRIHQTGGRWCFTGDGLSMPRNLLAQLTEQIERESREASESPAAFVRANSHRWHRVVDELCEEQVAGLRVVNAEGDELEFCAAEYRVEDEAALAPALEAALEFEAEAKDDAGVRSFAWLERGTEGQRRSYGRLEIRKGILRLECNSRKRLATGRRLVETHGGRWLRHVRDSFRSLDEVKRKTLGRKARRKASGKSGVPPEVEREILLKYKAEHYSKWPDEPLPALGGLTPREAAQSETGRRELEDLLRTMENGEERARREGRAAFDFSAVRKSLGM